MSNMGHNGGPAFPLPGMNLPNDQFCWPEHGMTLRDYFAGQALMGLLSSNGYLGYDDAAVEAYAHADAMLLKREKRE